jgi:hypothetical protein
MSEQRPRFALLVATACGSLALALGLSCGKLGELPTAPTSEPPDPGATFTRVQTEIFTPTCGAIGCHGRLGPQEQLILAPSFAYANIVGKPSVESSLLRVMPLDPDSSYLYKKIAGPTGITGDRMPENLPPLSSAQVKLVRDWILRGAPND